MNARAVATGLAALLTVSLGSALSLFASPPPLSGLLSPSWGRWLLVCLYAAAVAVVQVVSWKEPGLPAAGRSPGAGGRRWTVLVTLGSGVTGLAGLGLLWFIDGLWPAFVIGGPVMIALSTGSPVSDGGFPSHAVRLTIDLLLLALVLPIVGFAAGGTALALYPWTTSASLVVPSLAFLIAIHPEVLADSDPRYHERTDRLVTLGLAVLGFSGVLLVGHFFPGSSEIRLLGISPALVVAITAAAALLHPSAEGGRRLSEILVPVSYLSMVVGLSVIYAIA